MGHNIRCPAFVGVSFVHNWCWLKAYLCSLWYSKTNMEMRLGSRFCVVAYAVQKQEVIRADEGDSEYVY